jgi:DNA-binding NarL/FixJ family response regulator
MTIRVLVADDQSMVRAGFRMLLAGEADIDVVAEASTGLEAVEKAARLHPSVVLMDIRMPVLDGLQATRRILAADRAARVLILTTFDLDEYVYEALRAGASGFVLKDDPPEQLIAAVRTVAAGDALLSPAVTKRVISAFTRIPRTATPDAVRDLSERELEVFRLIARGLSNAEIGHELFISETTVKTHVTHILQKLDLRDRVQAVACVPAGIFDLTNRVPEGTPAGGASTRWRCRRIGWRGRAARAVTHRERRSVKALRRRSNQRSTRAATVPTLWAMRQGPDQDRRMSARPPARRRPPSSAPEGPGPTTAPQPDPAARREHGATPRPDESTRHGPST